MKNIAGNPYLKKDKDNLFVDLIPINIILKKSRTPLMLLLENRIRDNINNFRNAFNTRFDNIKYFYSFKANYLTEICNIICSEGVGAEIVSLPELKLALKIGVPPDEILVGGPYLPKNLIEKCIENKVRELIVYNLNDLIKINEIAEKYNHFQSICIRVNSQKYNSKLGIILNEKNINKLKTIINTCNNIKVNTILSHYSTQMNNTEQFKKNIIVIIQNLKKLEENGIDIQNVNLGGGFPEATIMPQEQLKKIAADIGEIIEESNFTPKNIFIEPGRYFVGDAGIFISKVINVGEGWAILNIGSHICPKFARCSLRFYNITQINSPHKYKLSLLGIVPTDQDVLAKDYFFTQNVNEGDNVLVTNVGAYTLTFSNRFPYSLPDIFLVKDDKIRRIFDSVSDHDISIF